MKIYIVAIEHEYGVNLSACTSARFANQVVLEFVNEWWPNYSDEPIPKNDQDAIDRYFDMTNGEESYTIEGPVDLVGYEKPKPKRKTKTN
jgi:hypothetical protein